MALTLFYITNNTQVALIAEKYGVDRIWVDLETLGKEDRQKNINSVKSNHTIEDVSLIKSVLTRSELLVRVNPIHEHSQEEIDAVIAGGTDIIMLPMWRSVDDVRQFLQMVDRRAKTTLLLETKEAVECVDEVLKLDFDEIHIGLNDLHLSYGLTFMFELLSNGTVEMLCKKFKAKGIPYGFGGIARLGKGLLHSEKVIMEHYRLGSTRAILSRSFCNVNKMKSMDEMDRMFAAGMKTLREYEAICATASDEMFEANRKDVAKCVADVVDTLHSY
ncbi:MAG: aldolase [Clostridia bacterium]|nr:aldolase [Clostridia bacterium]